MDTSRKMPILSYGLLSLVFILTVFSGSVFAYSFQELPKEATTELSLTEPELQESQDDVVTEELVDGVFLGETPSDSASTIISSERAIEIALTQVPNGTVIEVDHDFEDGLEVWDIEIHAAGYVHEIYVDMATGDIIEHDIDEAWD
jgi:uncharacterized membrane protein YkoI